MDNLSVYFVTWNVGTKYPEEYLDLHPLLSLPHLNKKHEAKCDLPDFYIISLQEVKAQPQDIVASLLFEDPWTAIFSSILRKSDYIKLKTIRLQGLVLNVFCLKKHLLNIREMESDYTRTGLSGMWGNKGAVSVRLSIYGCTICFVNAHLSAHEDKLDDRVDDYNKIIEDQKFHVKEQTQIFFHDYVFWMGDLNFRLREEYEKSPEEIERMIKQNDLDKLFEHDQLVYVMKKGDAFSELTENKPTFPPTFKYEPGSSNYDYKRKPAWTDRILYRVSPDNYENVKLKATQTMYTAHDYKISDHRPVTGAFNIKLPHCMIPSMSSSRETLTDSIQGANGSFQVFADYSEQVVKFDKFTWYIDQENTASYKICQSPTQNVAKDDWIGLFKADFYSLDDYLLYVYVSKGSSPLPQTKSPSHSSRRETSQAITFPELPSRNLGTSYRLVYFSQTEDKVVSVLGVSDPFDVTINPETAFN